VPLAQISIYRFAAVLDGCTHRSWQFVRSTTWVLELRDGWPFFAEETRGETTQAVTWPSQAMRRQGWKVRYLKPRPQKPGWTM
jgi:hypothetical protein